VVNQALPTSLAESVGHGQKAYPSPALARAEAVGKCCSDDRRGFGNDPDQTRRHVASAQMLDQSLKKGRYHIHVKDCSSGHVEVAPLVGVV
jgi:hypothetical protein